MKNQVFKDGWHLPFTAGANITGGDLVKVGSVIGVATGDIASGADGVAVVHGVYSVGKESEAIDQGTALYYKESTGKVTATAQGNTFAGYAWGSALLADTTVDLRLEF